jgi:hypothetical protein
MCRSVHACVYRACVCNVMFSQLWVFDLRPWEMLVDDVVGVKWLTCTALNSVDIDEETAHARALVSAVRVPASRARTAEADADACDVDVDDDDEDDEDEQPANVAAAAADVSVAAAGAAGAAAAAALVTLDKHGDKRSCRASSSGAQCSSKSAVTSRFSPIASSSTTARRRCRRQ